MLNPLIKKKLLNIFAIIIFVLIALMIVIPYVFKDDIMKPSEEVEENLPILLQPQQITASI